ncbi:hypothetical protein ADICYQ_0765 [Cyclobacterium qasimii M12-11B]|uniref:Uncharacterized protein n=1 Tax=Cyclobacterium qasimii M12-11B TaxID=641524 RepID=S7VLX3_9BACT|nr:hypothetical protein ADICYQ_0765 [Cyclobacterium qasimii M12-11B]
MKPSKKVRGIFKTRTILMANYFRYLSVKEVLPAMKKVL